MKPFNRGRRIFLAALLLTCAWTPLVHSGVQGKENTRTTPVPVDVQRKAPPAFEQFARTELYFGSAKPDGSVVTEEEFRQFLDQEITPRFPDGLTLFVGLGQFRGSNGVIVQERSMLVILLYPLPTKESNEKIEQIREKYKTSFQQESVLRVDSRGRVSF